MFFDVCVCIFSLTGYKLLSPVSLFIFEDFIFIYKMFFRFININVYYKDFILITFS